MDSITHFASGALLAAAMPKAPKTRWFIPFGMFCASVPDIDMLYRFWDPTMMLTFHRSLTHSIFIAPLLALLTSAAFLPLLRKNNKTQWALTHYSLFAFCAILMHIFLDFMTTFGTQIFWPISPMRVNFPAMFIIDLCLTLPLLACMYLACLRRKKSPSLARYGVLWVFLYPLLCLGIQQSLEVTIAKAQRKQDPTISAVSVYPEPFSPFIWKLVLTTAESYRIAPISLFQNISQLNFISYPRPSQALWQRLEQQDTFFTTYKNFAHFIALQDNILLATTDNAAQEATTQITRFYDLRLTFATPLFASWVGKNHPFLLEIQRDAQDNLLAWRYRKNAKVTPEWTLVD